MPESAAHRFAAPMRSAYMPLAKKRNTVVAANSSPPLWA
jgi:hypothetical protein